MTSHYIGLKQIVAWEQSKEGEEGYAVKYPDGYISWSPKDVFEAAYLHLGDIERYAPHQQRMLGESAIVEKWFRGISAFIDSDRFNTVDSVEQSRMKAQRDAMKTYLDALYARIGVWIE
jgi:hypothetical protein